MCQVCCVAGVCIAEIPVSHHASPVTEPDTTPNTTIGRAFAHMASATCAAAAAPLPSVSVFLSTSSSSVGMAALLSSRVSVSTDEQKEAAQEEEEEEDEDVLIGITRVVMNKTATQAATSAKRKGKEKNAMRDEADAWEAKLTHKGVCMGCGCEWDVHTLMTRTMHVWRC